MWSFPTNSYESRKSFNILGIQTVSDIGFYSPSIDGANSQHLKKYRIWLLAKYENIAGGDIVLAMKMHAVINPIGNCLWNISDQTLLGFLTQYLYIRRPCLTLTSLVVSKSLPTILMLISAVIWTLYKSIEHVGFLLIAKFNSQNRKLSRKCE
jgi:hypothetical protein